MNFILVVMIMPPGVIWWERNIRGKYKFCCCCKREQGESKDEDKEPELGRMEIFFDTTFNRVV